MVIFRPEKPQSHRPARSNYLDEFSYYPLHCAGEKVADNNWTVTCHSYDRQLAYFANSIQFKEGASLPKNGKAELRWYNFYMLVAYLTDTL